MEEKKRLRGAIYARVSTSLQEYNRQITELEKVAESKNIDIIYKFEEVVSGYSDNRSEFKKLMSLTKDDVDVVLIWEYSRLGRKSSEMAVALNYFIEQKINLYIHTLRLSTLNECGDIDITGKILLGIVGVFSEEEGRLIRERTKAGKRDSVLTKGNAHSSKIPFGYCKEDKKLKIDPITSPIVREIFEKTVEGMSSYKITRYLNSKGILNEGKKFTTAMVNYLLNNKIYIGELEYGKKKGEIVYLTKPELQIISNTLWEQTQLAKKNNKMIRSLSDRSGRYLLQGLMVCPECGRKLCYENNSKKKSRYKCSSTFEDFKVGNKKICSTKTYTSEQIEEVIMNCCRPKISMAYSIQYNKELRSKVEDECRIIEEQIKEDENTLSTYQDNLTTALEKLYTVKSSSVLTSYQKSIEILTKNIENLEEKIISEKDQLRFCAKKLNRYTINETNKEWDDYDLLHNSVNSITPYSDSDTRDTLFIVDLKNNRPFYIFYSPFKGYYSVSEITTEEDIQPEIELDESLIDEEVVNQENAMDYVSYIESNRKEYEDLRKWSIKNLIDNKNKYPKNLLTNYFDTKRRVGIINGVEYTLKDYIHYNHLLGNKVIFGRGLNYPKYKK